MAAETPTAFFPISEISTYHSKWVIRGRVTAKGNLRSFNSRNGSSQQVFDCTLLDESGEIRANFFGQMAEKFYGTLEQGKVYSFSRGGCRIANRQYNRTNHRYELVFDRDGDIVAVADDGKIDTVRFNFVDLRAVQSRTLPCSVDLCGVLVRAAPVVTFTTKDGKELVKRELTIADDTATSMVVALWGDRAKQDDKVFEGQPVVCLKGVSIKEFKGGRSGSLELAGSIVFDSKLDDAARIQRWWAASGATASLTSLSMGGEGIVDLQALQSKPLPCTVDICGVVVGFKPTFSFTSQAGKDLVKREIVIADPSCLSMQVTLWGERAQKEDAAFDNHAVVLLRGVLVKEWNGGRSGSLLEAGSMVFAPTTPEADAVSRWWSEGGSAASLTALSLEGGAGAAAGRVPEDRACTVAEMRRSAEMMTGQSELYSVVSRLAFVQMRKQGETQPLVYMACQEAVPGTSRTCNKRVGEDGFCASCGRIVKTAPRLAIRCRFADCTDGAWLTTFHEPAQSVLKMTADECRAKELGEGGREALESAIRRRFFQEPLQVTVRAKLDTYNGEQRTNITCVDARPVQYGSHGRLMLKNIKGMLEKMAEMAKVGA